MLMEPAVRTQWLVGACPVVMCTKKPTLSFSPARIMLMLFSMLCLFSPESTTISSTVPWVFLSKTSLSEAIMYYPERWKCLSGQLLTGLFFFFFMKRSLIKNSRWDLRKKKRLYYENGNIVWPFFIISKLKMFCWYFTIKSQARFYTWAAKQMSKHIQVNLWCTHYLIITICTAFMNCIIHRVQKISATVTSTGQRLSHGVRFLEQK